MMGDFVNWVVDGGYVALIAFGSIFGTTLLLMKISKRAIKIKNLKWRKIVMWLLRFAVCGGIATIIYFIFKK